MSEHVERVKERVNKSVNNKRVSTYREHMRKLGVSQVNNLVPDENIEDLRLFADRLRSEHFLKICELDPDDERREILANRNQVRIPTHTEISALETSIERAALPLKGELKALTDSVHGAMRAQAALYATHKAGGEDAEFVKWASLAVAHAHMAKYQHEWLSRQLELASGRSSP